MSDEYRMISTHSSDIIPNWNDIRSYFGYNMLYEIAGSLGFKVKRGAQYDN